MKKIKDCGQMMIITGLETGDGKTGDGADSTVTACSHQSVPVSASIPVLKHGYISTLNFYPVYTLLILFILILNSSIFAQEVTLSLDCPDAIAPGPLETIVDLDMQNDVTTSGYQFQVHVSPPGAGVITDIQQGEQSDHILMTWIWVEDQQFYQVVAFDFSGNSFIEPGSGTISEIRFIATQYHENVELEIQNFIIGEWGTGMEMNVNHPEPCQFPVIEHEVFLHFGILNPVNQTLELWVENTETFYHFQFGVTGLVMEEILPGDDLSDASYALQVHSDWEYVLGFGIPECHLDPGVHLIGTVHYSEITEDEICFHGPAYFGNDWGGTVVPVQSQECIPADPCTNLGDINGDQSHDVLDIVLAVSLIVESDYHYCVDLNFDGVIDVLDIVLLVNMIIEGG